MTNYFTKHPLNTLVIVSEDENAISYLKDNLSLTNLSFYNIHTFKSTIDLFDFCSKEAPSFIIVDISLLTFDLFEEIISYFEYIPIVILSEYKQDEEVLFYISKGAQSYLVKNNYNHHQLKKTILLSHEHLTLKRENEAKSKRIEYILESITDCFYVLDFNWIITYWNKAAEVTLGKSKMETIGKSFLEVYPELLNSDVYHNYKTAFADKTSLHFNYFFPTLSRWYEIQLDPSFEGLSVCFRDITLRINSEKEKEAMIEELSHKNNDLKQFSFITSHNLRSPLTNIKGILNIINTNTLDESNRELFELLKSSANRLTKTIEDLSGILLVKNNSEAKPSLIIFNNIYKKVLNDLRKDYKDIHYDTDFQVKCIYTNSLYMESVFYNLISNSIKYRHPDRQLIIKVSSAYNDKGQIVIKLSDNGLGINVNRHKDRIFGLYQRFHSNTHGQGLGLYMVKSQIASMGGNIEVESEENAGATFIITLPEKTAEKNKV